ncbi:MAG: hypothetical protein ABIQ16_18135 [Polyangiaceae bacterium]
MIDQEAAIAIARQRAVLNGWALVEPLQVVHRRGWLGQKDRFEIDSDPALRGPKTRFVIDAESGKILSEGYIPR